ncbi:MAG: ExbD/TolR family protein [Rhizobacter sp.]
MLSCRPLTALLLACSSMFLCACHVPNASPHSVLQVSAAGALTLDGKPLSHEQLNNALSNRRTAVPDLVVEVRASPEADMTQVKAVVAAVELAHARVTFAGEFGQQ